MVDRLTKEERSRLMSKIRSKGTGIEKKFMETHEGAISHPDWLPYYPDFLWHGMVVYVDSAFWHGIIPQKTYDGMTKFWKRKLLRNIVRDMIVDSFWKTLGCMERTMD